MTNKLDEIYQSKKNYYILFFIMVAISEVSIMIFYYSDFVIFIKKPMNIGITYIEQISLFIFFSLLLTVFFLKLYIIDNKKKKIDDRIEMRLISVFLGVSYIVFLTFIHFELAQILSLELKELVSFYAVISGSLYGVLISSLFYIIKEVSNKFFKVKNKFLRCIIIKLKRKKSVTQLLMMLILLSVFSLFIIPISEFNNGLDYYLLVFGIIFSSSVSNTLTSK
ncbi:MULTISPECIES: hypothetical protein [Providencia]|uniref:hypothetical protein n=1 Tax=Providencia TaxID=586 RepID=UPI0018C55085|nr:MULTISPECIES: hypothetical protein [Providencia]MBG5921534.1 hypothetical protein [Providencia rettgeri]MBQ0531914.1 hypothetical protein [Providencia rettgeri]WOB85464.1 hypothetical protein P3L40_17765 [Providencia sp. PROV040]HEM8211688.1 hypothetical protein [Providencia rettgeri]